MGKTGSLSAMTKVLLDSGESPRRKFRWYSAEQRGCSQQERLIYLWITLTVPINHSIPHMGCLGPSTTNLTRTPPASACLLNILMPSSPPPGLELKFPWNFPGHSDSKPVLNAALRALREEFRPSSELLLTWPQADPL